MKQRTLQHADDTQLSMLQQQKEGELEKVQREMKQLEQQVCDLHRCRALDLVERLGSVERNREKVDESRMMWFAAAWAVVSGRSVLVIRHPFHWR